ncbi:MAG: AI-2E family transporter [Anaerolineaceae bacterium]|nr:AI-2E family transporter [Anaerolineaceae bacterium]
MDKTPLSQPVQWTFRRVVGATLIFVGILLCFWLFYRFYVVVFIVFVAIILGTVIRPIVSWLYLHKVPKIAGVILVYVVFLALALGFILMLFPLVFEQGSIIIDSLPEYYQGIRTWMDNSPNQLIITLGQILPREVPSFSELQQTGPEMIITAEQAMVFVKSVSKGGFLVIVVLILAFHWTLEGQRTIRYFLFLLPKPLRLDLSELINVIEVKIGYFIFGKGVLSLAVGVLALIAYLIIGLPNVVVLAIIAGIFEAVPMIGPTLGAVPAAIIALSIAPSKLIWVVGASIVIQLIENNLLGPRVMSKAVGVNPFVSLLSIFAFGSLFGIVGALMAIPMAAVIQVLLDRYVFHRTGVELETDSGRDLSSRLRYEANDLARDLQKQARFKKGGSDITEKQIDFVMEEIESVSTDLSLLLAETSSFNYD